MHAHHSVSPSPAAFLLRALLVLDICCTGCLAQAAHAVLTDANFKHAVTACVGVWKLGIRITYFHDGQDPVSGDCVGGEFGPISTWETSRVTDMSRGACSTPALRAAPWPDSDTACHDPRPSRPFPP